MSLVLKFRLNFADPFSCHYHQLTWAKHGLWITKSSTESQSQDKHCPTSMSNVGATWTTSWLGESPRAGYKLASITPNKWPTPTQTVTMHRWSREGKTAQRLRHDAKSKGLWVKQFRGKLLTWRKRLTTHRHWAPKCAGCTWNPDGEKRG